MCSIVCSMCILSILSLNALECSRCCLRTRIILAQRMKWVVSIVGERSSISCLGIEKELEELVDWNRFVHSATECLDAALNLPIGHGGGMADTLEKTLQLRVLDDTIVVPVGLLDDVAKVGVGRFAIKIGLIVLLENGSKLGLTLFHHVSFVRHLLHLG